MARRRKYDIDKILAAHMVRCPHCKAELMPEETMRTGWNELQCKRCGKKFQTAVLAFDVPAPEIDI